MRGTLFQSYLLSRTTLRTERTRRGSLRYSTPQEPFVKQPSCVHGVSELRMKTKLANKTYEGKDSDKRSFSELIVLKVLGSLFSQLYVLNIVI